MRRARLFSDQRGVAYLEFGLMLPILLLVTMGMIELSRFILINQKLDKVANTVTDLVTQTDGATRADLDKFFNAAQNMTSPYPFPARGYIVVSSVKRFTGVTNPVVQWQYGGGGTTSKTSLVGTTNQDATLPNGFTLQDDEQVIITEVFYRFDPMFSFQLPVLQSLNAANIYKTATYKPRLGALDTLN